MAAGTFALYTHAVDQADRAQVERYRCYRLADELRQSSDDLTRMARTYVVTGESQYRQRYQEVLDIRNGTKLRPEAYGGGSWNLVTPKGGALGIYSHQGIPLLELMRQAGFTDGEFRKLSEAMANSNELVLREMEAMKLSETKGPAALTSRARARVILFEEPYNQAKATIEKPIDDFYVLLNQRTDADVKSANAHASAYRISFLILVLGLMFTLWRAYRTLRETLGAPLDEVYERITHIGLGDFSHSSPGRATPRDSVMAWLTEMQNKLMRSDLELKHAEEREYLTRQLELLLQSTGDGIYGIDLNGNFTFINEAALRMLGQAKAEVLGRNAHELIHHSHADGSVFAMADCPIYRVLHTDQGCRVDDEVLWRKDGSSFPAGYASFPILVHGVTAGAVVTFSDTTERKRIETELRLSEARFRSVMASGMIGLFLWNSKGDITDGNEAFLRIIGYTKEDLVAGRISWSELTPPEYQAMDEAAVQTVAATGMCEPYEKEFFRKDGSRVPILIAGGSLPGLEGEGVAFVVDITTRKQAEDAMRFAIHQARAADRTKSAFLAAMSHELRTPLNSVIGFTGVLLKGMLGELNSRQMDTLRVVQRNGRHLLDLINDVLDLSKIEAGELVLSSVTFDLVQTSREALATISPLAETKGLVLESCFRVEALNWKGDPRRVSQILLNLLSNAVKFTETGSVSLALEIEDGMAKISMRDTGRGIAERDCSRLFQEFLQLDDGLSRKNEGTGLGLALSRRLARMMNGDITVESVVGTGSTFIVRLPLTIAEAIP